MDRPQYSLYLSHSWLPEHVDLNIALWDCLWEDVLMHADDNQEEAPPFYVSRVEHLIRQSDMFMAVLVPPADVETARPATWEAAGHRVSPYVRLEMSLAQRVRLPRFILYDTALDFEPPGEQTDHVRCIEFDHRDLKALSGDVAAAIADWLAAVTAASPPRPFRPSERAAVLLPPSPDPDTVIDAVRGALEGAGYREVADLSSVATDIEAMELLRSVDLLVADVGDKSVWDIYGMAHVLMVPTIRLVRGALPIDQERLPFLLRGHPVGYDDNLVAWSESAELAAAVGAQAEAIRKPMIEIDLLDEGREFFARRR